MCGLCLSGPDFLEAQQEHRAVAARLESLARSYRAMANGEIHPHRPSGSLRQAHDDAMAIYRHLHREWIVPDDHDMDAEEDLQEQAKDAAIDERRKTKP